MANNCKPNICGNPCGVSVTNTAACESLPSQIQNFSDQFFGVVVKTEIDGQVTWSLPCSLEEGLPNNPRLAGEGLACMFLRYFEDGIIGLTGPQGDTGENGVDGRNAYTVTLASFIQPTSEAPNIQIPTSYNPAILAGMNVFIGSSGWFTVNENDSSGMLFLTLLRSLDGVSGVIPAGRLVVPSGFQGAEGLQGETGEQGPQGPAGPAFVNTLGFFVGSGVNYNLTATPAALDFGGLVASVSLPTPGTYMLTGSVGLLGLAGVVDADVATLKFRNVFTSTDILGSTKTLNFIANTQKEQIIIHAILATTTENEQIAIFGSATNPGVIAAVAAETTISFVKLA